MLRELLEENYTEIHHNVSEAYLVSILKREAEESRQKLRQCIVIENRKKGGYLEGGPLNDDIKVVFCGFRIVEDLQNRVFVFLPSEDHQAIFIEPFDPLHYENPDVIDIDDRKMLLDIGS